MTLIPVSGTVTETCAQLSGRIKGYAFVPSGSTLLIADFPLDYESANFVAYSVIKDGYPVYFAVVENPDGENPIDINAMADKIAKTFREYSED